ncbi:MAG: zinc metallopeptidase [Rhodothermia bacterium]|nr:zinc metallopeptidase [Rhodothermia bacterium]
MRWQSRRRSKNVEDRRVRPALGGRRTAKVGGGFVLIALLAVVFLGEDAGKLIGMLGGLQQQTTQTAPPSSPRTSPESDKLADFVSVVLAETEDTWGAIFAAAGSRYQPPRLVLFTDAVQSACGMSSAATGPFYCPADRQVYLDLGFFNELRRFGASGDFALAYVIAHEVGHHVQTLVGTEDEVRNLRQRVSRRQANALSVLMELQADCYAGVWGRSVQERGLLDAGDVEEGLNAAASIGDDRLQRMSGRRVQPESFTHGSSAQRVEWFRRGLSSGSTDACDTFAELRQ